MKYLKKFETEADKNAWREGSEFVTPNVVLTDGQVEYNVAMDPSTLPLYIEAINDLTIKFGNRYQYSKDKSTWLSGTSSTSISANAGEKVYFMASGLTPSSSNGIGTFTISGKCNVGGNVMSMIYGADFKGQKVITSSYQFNRLFNQCTTLSDASSLVLPATTLTEYCYLNMFRQCISLVNAPALPATTLADYCYNSMFLDCRRLVKAPVLPATTLASSCYSYMFNGCTDLNYIKAMFTTKPTSSYTADWVSGVSATGTFVKNAAATWNVTGANGVPSGWTVETADA